MKGDLWIITGKTSDADGGDGGMHGHVGEAAVALLVRQ
jgi:hypothetical protein